jgi:disulfide bond formation protein DsbB
MSALKDTELATPRLSGEAAAGGQAWTLLGLLVSLLALWGSLYLTLGMGLIACPLCLYQRTFVMGALAVLGMGWLAGARSSGILELMALPCGVGGLGVAIFHEYLEQIGKLECPAGIMGLGTAPQQSLAVFVVLSAILTWRSLVGGPTGGIRLGWTGIAVILGVLFAVAAVKSAPPMPDPKPHDYPLNMCQPPYHPR